MSPLVFFAYQEAMNPSMPIPMYGFCFMMERTLRRSRSADNAIELLRAIEILRRLLPRCRGPFSTRSGIRFPSGGADEPIRDRAARVRVCLRGALVGMWLSGALPERHLSADSREVVGLGIGMIATMTALVLAS